ncbi:MAG TPA: DUF2905 domain-containing protein [Candidatus Acidoferrales bacterium]|nr:DUF2905 domain-containing protein [Candidatus Acidoferrales bacterium]
MEPLREVGKVLLVFGIVIAAVGAFLMTGAKMPLRLGRLPGDISYHGRHGTFYFPIVTCVILSVVLTVILWIVGTIRR